MKKVIVLILLIALVMVFMVPVAIAKGDPKVDICHFSGHFSDVWTGTSDFPFVEGEPWCDWLGGKVINVSMNGWENGHMQ